MDRNLKIDNIDLKILSELSKNAKLPYTDVANRVFVSGGTVHVRMQKMEQAGIVKGSTLALDYSALGYDVTAFLGIYLEKSSMYEDVVAELQKIPEILNLHYTTGAYSIFARILCRDTKHLREVLHDKIQSVVGIERTETFISLEERIDRPPLLY
ncbi:Lrp/AsnC ligand binding domain-containing protein [Hugenholtzia roseola]|uniref:Lrp/AsnC ligand binding domain-containing protein n=1 Tax=Hugenholtzia roseola TaxID=1002 RepID=UPI0004255403|nr:Lrp/AsnC ligand binding domain-containing protein [Hugenholtzia roseola]